MKTSKGTKPNRNGDTSGVVTTARPPPVCGTMVHTDLDCHNCESPCRFRPQGRRACTDVGAFAASRYPVWCNDLGQIPCTDPPACCKMCEQNAVSRPPDPLASLRPAGRCVPPPVCDPCLPRRVPARVTLYCPAALLGIRVLPLTPLA